MNSSAKEIKDKLEDIGVKITDGAISFL